MNHFVRNLKKAINVQIIIKTNTSATWFWRDCLRLRALDNFKLEVWMGETITDGITRL
jgi:hypothetical protein